MVKIAVVEDDKSERWILSDFLRKKGYTVFDFEWGEEAFKFFEKNPVEVVISDLRLPGLSGVELLEKVKALRPQTEFIIVTAYGDVNSAVEAMKKGAYDYLLKPLNLEELLLKLKRIEEKFLLVRKLEEIESEIRYSKGTIIAESRQMKEIVKMAKEVAPTNTSVLITGESGTGKEVLARFIHEHSGRVGAFLPLSCAAIPETLLETELFGYEKGAFTGATIDKPGKIELADGGTLFLDEIGELSPPLQAKLLRVLEDKEVTRLGSTKTKRVNVRYLFATNRDLEKMVKEGTFREDLFYRINVFHIKIPPLRERIEDIIPLAHYFLKKFSKELNKSIRGFTEDAQSALLLYKWPGNVRELQNVIERACVLCKGELITKDLLFLQELGGAVSMKLKDVEKEHIRKVLQLVDWNISKASEILGIHRNTLRLKIKEYGLEEQN
uniref:Sigma-54-dependent Fis family transcriptional regulator n=1 Tax=candidate division WOR-3 bacterium TaxID=2052148 RepID=A0A7V3ZX37_UNCW3